MKDEATMKAAVFDKYGPPDLLSLVEIAVPNPAAHEIRVKVHATTVNRTDTATLRGYPFFARAATGLIHPQMRTLGMDFSGTVEALGDGVTEFQLGDRIFGLIPDQFGAHAEYLCLPADAAIAHIPEGIEFSEAVVCEGAWYASSTTNLLCEGQSCLIFGASGAIGTAAVQLAKSRGAKVTAVVGTRHVDLARQLGADVVVNYEEEDFTAIGQTFDLVLDAVGKTSWFQCRPLLKKKAIFTATDLGPYWSNIFLSIWNGINRRRRVRVPYPKDAPGFVKSLEQLMSTGQFRGVFDRSYGLNSIVEAFRYVESGQKTGIVVINIQ